MQQPDWLERAWRDYGVREVRSGDNPRIVQMFRDAGHPGIKRDEVAWCAAFVGACLERAGHRSTRSLMARSYLRWGDHIESSRVGAIAVLSRGSDPSLGHVGFVVGEAEGKLYLLGGNQGQRVSVDAFDRSRLLGLRWPSAGEQAAVGSEKLGQAPKNGAAGSTAAERDDASEPGPAFDAALAHVLEMEGGFSDDPHDPGGPTNKGITLEVFARWLGERVDDRSRSRLVARLKRIPSEMVREIYLTRYWRPAGCASMPAALATMHFDAAVNHGVGAAIRFLQRAVGADVDGEIGPQTRSRIAAVDPLSTLVRYAELRRERYRALHHFWRFGRGWLRRVDDTLARASVLVNEPSHEPATDVVRSAGKHSLQSDSQGESHMTTDEPQKSKPKWWGESITIWGVIVTALATVAPVLGPLIGLDVTAEMVQQLGQQVVEIAQAVGGVIGTLMAIYGRVRATSPIERRLISVRI